MDDPAFTQARDADLDNFRRGRWNRTQSYTYGQTMNGTSVLPSLSSNTGTSTATTSREHRYTAPSGGLGGGGSMFAAANAARGRRTATAANKELCILDEDPSSSGHEGSESGDIHNSPCPPQSKCPSRLGVSTKPKVLRNGLDRPTSLGPAMAMRR